MRRGATFFGSRAIAGGDLSGWVWVALVAFILVGGAVLTVLWPRTHWSFSASAADIIAEYIEPEPVEFPLVFRLGLIVLVVEVAAWIVALAERA